MVTLVAATATLLLLWPRVAGAEDEAKARALFQRGRELLGAGRIDEACDAFQQSTTEFAASSGSWLNLAVCREKQGKIASAWHAYGRAAEVAEAAGDERKASAARQFAIGLEPRLPKLTIAVPVRVLGLLVQLDGSALSNEQWGVALPVDPGAHVVKVSAPRYEEWSTSVELAPPRQQAKVVVPRLRPIGGVAPAAPTDAPAGNEGLAEAAVAPGDGSEHGSSDEGGDSATTAAIALVATGGAALAAGAACGIASLVLQSDYEAEPTVEKADEGDRVTLAADVSFIVGVAAAGAGLIVFLVGSGDDGAAADAEGADEPAASAEALVRRLHLAPVGPAGEPGFTAVWRF